MTTGDVDAASSRSIAQVLADTQRLVNPSLEAAAEMLPLELRVVTKYHFGWCDATGHPVSVKGGKMIRAALALLAAQVTGGEVEQALAAAVAVELVHNFSLLHDDVIDRDQLRRHRPTAWTVFGVPAAILAGDALLGLAYRVLGDRSEASIEAVKVLSRSIEKMLCGQKQDIDLEARSSAVSLAECESMATAKTGALIGCACALGALGAGADGSVAQQMRGFGEELGLAFQLVDDVLGIWGNPDETGKSTRSDLQSRKKSLPVVYAFNSGESSADELMSLYELPRELSEPELGRAAALIEVTGARRWALREARRHAQAALAGIEGWTANPIAMHELSVLADRICDRPS